MCVNVYTSPQDQYSRSSVDRHGGCLSADDDSNDDDDNGVIDLEMVIYYT